MAASELLQLIDLSLGGEPPCGVVNFNYMHALMHEIVRRLVQLEGVVISNSVVEGGATYIQHASAAEPTGKSADGSSPKLSSMAVGPSKQPDVASSKQVDSKSTQVAAAGERARSTTSADIAATVAATPPHEAQFGSGEPKIVSDDTIVRDGGIVKGDENVTPTTDASITSVDKKKQSGTSFVTIKDITTSKEVGSLDETKITHELGTQLSGDVVGHTSPIGTSMSHMSMRHPSATSSVGIYHTPSSRSRPHMISASNELVAMERKITELENRLGTVEALPDLLERKGANVMATPVKDLWNFTSLTKRVDAAEDGIHHVRS